MERKKRSNHAVHWDEGKVSDILESSSDDNLTGYFALHKKPLTFERMSGGKQRVLEFSYVKVAKEEASSPTTSLLF